MTSPIITPHHHLSSSAHSAAQPRTTASEHAVDIQAAGPLNDADRAPALVLLLVVAGLAPSAAAEAGAVEEPDVDPGAPEESAVLVASAVPETGPVAVAVPRLNDPSDVLVAVMFDILNDPTDVFSVLLEAALLGVGVGVPITEEDDGWPMLMFLIVNLPDALPLSPKRTRMYVLRFVTEGTVISARPLVMGKPWARGLLRSKCSLSPSASSKYPKTIIPVLLKPGGITEVSHVQLCRSPTFQTVPVVG